MTGNHRYVAGKEELQVPVRTPLRPLRTNPYLGGNASAHRRSIQPFPPKFGTQLTACSPR